MERCMIMAAIENLTKKNVKSILNELLVEAQKEPEQPYSAAYERMRMQSLRQQIKIVELFLEECRYEEIEEQVRSLERLVKGQPRVAEELTT